MLEESILAFYSGNLLHFFNTETKELQFRRSSGGGGIGHIAVSTHLHFIYLFYYFKHKSSLLVHDTITPMDFSIFAPLF